MKILLHACCGPCSLAPTRLLMEQDASFSIYFSNPNIHPATEYEHRLETICDCVAKPNGIELVCAAYDPQTWEEVAGIHGTDREARCRACYRLRFERAAAYAASQGFDAIDSTLSISPYQYTNTILEELERAANLHGIKSAGTDYHEFYQEATRRSKQLGMYRQNYCGCRFSMAEAALERKERAAEHERAKLIKQRALATALAEGVVNQSTQL